MVKKYRSSRAGGQGVQAAPGHETERDSCPVGEGGSNTWVNERGEICIGSECFSIAIKPDEDEVIVRVDRNKCGTDIEPFVDAVFAAIGRGGRTVYESVSRVKPPAVKYAVKAKGAKIVE
jgi:hypothetical protein